MVSLYSSSPILSPPPLPHRAGMLTSWENQTLWKHQVYKGNGDCIREGLLQGSIVMVSNGFYQMDIDPSVSSAAFTIKCTTTIQWAQCTWVERHTSASSYRGELLGTLGSLLLIQAAMHEYTGPRPYSTTLPIPLWYDMGVIFHALQLLCLIWENKNNRIYSP